MKRIKDIKEFEDIDTYYEISQIVEEVFQDRVEAHKHLVTANKEIERLNNIINKTINILELSAMNKGICTRPETDTIQSALLVLKGSDK